MFKNVLIVEDHQSVKISVENTLGLLGVNHFDYAYYCDDALLRLKNGLKEQLPYELLITDLSFADDGREQVLGSGAELVHSARALQPDLKVLVFSGEINPVVITGLFQKQHINGYVRKGRHDAQDLKDAIEQIFKGKKYIPVELQQAVRTKSGHEFTRYDEIIIAQLAQGTHQIDMPAYLKSQGLQPSSLSSVEKRLKQIREAMKFTSNEQLVAYCKDYHII